MNTEVKRETRDDFVTDFWKRMGYVFGVGCAFVPGMVVGLEIVARDLEKEEAKKS